MLVRRMNLEDLAIQTGLPVEVLEEMVELGLIGSLPELSEFDRCELRRVRRLIETLGLSHEAVEVILQMRRRLVALQNELARLRMENAMYRRIPRAGIWIEAEWVEGYE